MVEDDHGVKPKRTDVGYKRPPREHQFKKGAKPKPRKPKLPRAELRPGQILWKVLTEERRVQIGRKVSYMPAFELLLRKAQEVADKGNGTMRRLMLDLVMSTKDASSKDPPTELWIGGKFERYFEDWELS